MATRRKFLTSTAASIATAAGADSERIDCQSHLFSEEFLRLLEKRTTSPYVYRQGGALAIRYGYDFVGPERILHSSDHPWVDPGIIIERVKSLQIPEDHEARSFAGNARKLFGIED